MSEKVQSTATLLTLTAAKPGRTETSRNDAGEFDAKLTSAVESAEPQTKAKAPTPTSEGKPPVEAPPAEAPAPQVASKDTAADAAEVDAEEAGMLATFVVTETIVLETAPDAMLLEDAVTMIDVEATRLADSADGVDAPSETDAVLLDAGNATGSDQLGDPNSGQPSPTQATFVEPAAENAQITTPADYVDEAALADANRAQGEDSNAGLLTDPNSAAPIDPLETTVEGAGDQSKNRDKPSNKHDDTSQQDDLAANQTSTTESALAVAALPHESSKDSSDSGSTESADPADTNPTAGSSARDAARAESAEEAAPVERPTIDPARFVSRVSRAIEFANQQGGGPIEMRLSPPELGSLQVKIQVKDGAMTAKMEVETPAARNALLDNLPALRDRLEQQQIRIDKFDVEVRDQQQQRGGDWRQHQDHQQQMDQHRQQSRGEPRATRQPAAPLAVADDARAIRTIAFANNGINLVI